MRKSSLETNFANQIRFAGLPEPLAEYRFHATRKWRFDFAYPDLKLAIEIEGGIWRRGRHNRASGFVRDAEKYNEAAISGWRVLRIPTNMVEDGTGLVYLERALEGKDDGPETTDDGGLGNPDLGDAALGV